MIASTTTATTSPATAAGPRQPSKPQTDDAASGVLSRERLLRLFAQAPKAFWRFDIDFSLDHAADVARLAQLAGITGVFYIAVRSAEYSTFSDSGLRAVREIRDCGQKLGLHVDYRPRMLGDPAAIVARDQRLALAGGLIGIENRVSFHMPPPCVLWRDFPTFSNAYAAEWEGRYVSDARGEWDAEKEARVTDDAQVCLHPIWWTA